MKKKKLISIITSAMLAVCAIGFIGCDEKGEKGDTGAAGAAGKSAYEIWLAAGNTGSEADFLEWLKADAETVECDHEALFTYSLERGATCMHGDEVLNVCNDCQSAWITYDENLDEDNHEVDWVVTVPATCMVEGEKTIECTCGYTATMAYILDHEYEVSEEESYAETCEADGLTVAYCKNGCNSTEGDDSYYVFHRVEQVINLIPGHEYVRMPITDPSINPCEELHQTANVCKHCYEIEEGTIEVEEATGHAVTADWEVLSDPTKDAEGAVTGSCANCGLSNAVEVLPKLNTVDYGYEEVVPVSCTQKGKDKWTYTEEGWGKTFVFEVIVDELMHKNAAGQDMYVNYWDDNEPANPVGNVDEVFDNSPENCADASGMGKFTCKDCGKTFVVKITGNHTYTDNDLITTVPATCTADGYKEYKCTECDQNVKVVLNRLTHDYALTVNDEHTMVTFACKKGCSESVLDAAGEPGIKEVPCTDYHEYTAAEWLVVSGDIVIPVDAEGWYTVAGDVATSVAEGTEGAIAAIPGHVAATCQDAGYTYYSYVVEGDTVYGKLTHNKRGHYVNADYADVNIDKTHEYEWSDLAECFGELTTLPNDTIGYADLEIFENGGETCAEPGVAGFKCACCGKSFLINYTKDHTWTTLNEVDPTCTEKGYYEQECSVCDKTRNFVYEQAEPDHVWEVVNVVEADDVATIYLDCKNCTATDTIVAVSYDYSYVATTCAQDGRVYINYTWDHDNNPDTEAVAATPFLMKTYAKNSQLHFWNGTPIYVLKANETAGGYIEIVVPNSESTALEDNIVKVEKKNFYEHELEEIFGDMYNVADGGLEIFFNAEFTCQETGYAAFKCTCEGCPATNKQLIYNVRGDHAWAEIAFKVENATCEHPTYSYYKCTTEGCDEINKVDGEDQKTHVFSHEVTKAATKNSTGLVKISCANGCAGGEVLIPVVSEENGWILTTDTEATCKQEGVRIYTYNFSYTKDEVSYVNSVTYKETDPKTSHEEFEPATWSDDEYDYTGYICTKDPDGPHLVIVTKTEKVAEAE